MEIKLHASLRRAEWHRLRGHLIRRLQGSRQLWKETYCDSFSFLVLKFDFQLEVDQPIATRGFWRDSFHRVLCINYEYDLTDNDRYLTPTFGKRDLSTTYEDVLILLRLFPADAKRTRSARTVDARRPHNGRTTPAVRTQTRRKMDARWTQDAHVSDAKRTQNRCVSDAVFDKSFLGSTVYTYIHMYIHLPNWVT